MNEERFTGKADVYDKYRPSYPDSLTDWLYEKTKADTVADIGAGTGKLTACLLKKPWQVTAVEPNPDMREKLSGLKGVAVVNASAENTGIEPCSIGLITVAQAFHWFDRDKFRAECERILKPDGRLAVVYNHRDRQSKLTQESLELCRTMCSSHGSRSNHEELDEMLRNEYFSEVELFGDENNLKLDRQGFIGHELSRSHAPNVTDSDYMPYVNALNDLFSKYRKNESVTVKYNTICYLGKF